MTPYLRTESLKNYLAARTYIAHKWESPPGEF